MHQRYLFTPIYYYPDLRYLGLIFDVFLKWCRYSIFLTFKTIHSPSKLNLRAKQNIRKSTLFDILIETMRLNQVDACTFFNLFGFCLKKIIQPNPSLGILVISNTSLLFRHSKCIDFYHCWIKQKKKITIGSRCCLLQNSIVKTWKNKHRISI